MDCAWVFANNPNDFPEWIRKEVPVATEVTKLKTLEVKVVMCCSSCVEKVEEAVSGMAGVFEYKTDRWNDRLTIVQTPSGGPNHRQLVKKLRKATHDKKVAILECSSTKSSSSTPATTTTTTVIYRNPSIWPGYNPFITNPNYLQHPVGCGICMRNPGAICANCGRSNEMGAWFP